jgi:hypothetical protein
MSCLCNKIYDSPQGGTVDLLERELPKGGYFVGGAAEPLVLRPTAAPSLHAMTQAFTSKVHSRYVGWWTDSESGLLYIDATDWFPSLATATAVGRSRGEIAIFDIAAGEEVRLT